MILGRKTIPLSYLTYKFLDKQILKEEPPQLNKTAIKVLFLETKHLQDYGGK